MVDGSAANADTGPYVHVTRSQRFFQPNRTASPAMFFLQIMALQ